MTRVLILIIGAIALAIASSPDAEARCGRFGGGRGWFAHRREVRQERGFHPLQRLRDRRSCDAGDGQGGPEQIVAPSEVQPEIRVADASGE